MFKKKMGKKKLRVRPQKNLENIWLPTNLEARTLIAEWFPQLDAKQ